MKSVVSKIFLSLYFCFQCFAALLNVFAFTGLVLLFLLMHGLGGTHLHYHPWQHLCFFLIVFLILGLYAFYSYITVIAGIASIKIIKNKILTKFQKFSMITFLVVTIPFYIAMMIKPEILQIILWPIDMFFFNNAISDKLQSN